MLNKRSSPSKRGTPWFTAQVRWDNMEKLREIAGFHKAPITQTLARLITAEHNLLFPESRKELDAACTHNIRTT